MRDYLKIILLALIAAILPAPNDDLRAAVGGNGGPSRNRWRYEFYAGRWWYWKPDAQWSYYNGRSWVDWGREAPRPLGAGQTAGGASGRGGRRTMGYRATGVYPFNYSGASSPANSLPASNPGSIAPGTATVFGPDTIAGGGVGVGLETGSRSGDASSGVGGGSVGGADVSGFNRRK